MEVVAAGDDQGYAASNSRTNASAGDCCVCDCERRNASTSAAAAAFLFMGKEKPGMEGRSPWMAVVAACAAVGGLKGAGVTTDGPASAILGSCIAHRDGNGECLCKTKGVDHNENLHTYLI